MYYILLFIGVMSFLTFLSWLYPDGPAHARQARIPGPGPGQDSAPVDTLREQVARWLQGEWKEEKPCVTPIDCVQAGRCAGHCGRR